MPTKGQIMTDPANGNMYEYVETSQDSHGERVTLKETIKIKGLLVPKHIHVYQDETFEVISGKLTIWFDGKETTLSKGEKVTLPKSKPHNHYNNDEIPVTYIHSVSPALDFDYFMENLIGLAIELYFPPLTLVFNQ